MVLLAGCGGPGGPDQGVDSVDLATSAGPDQGIGSVDLAAPVRPDLFQPCMDGVRDGNETDVDCGGDACFGCAPKKRCVVDGDCHWGQCVNGTCTTCLNHITDGDETDPDCGGSCPPCANDHHCLTNGDCATGACLPLFQGVRFCVGVKHCADGALDADETDLDCGGPTCARCEGGARCVVDDDCLSGGCLKGACAPWACSGNSVPGTACRSAMVICDDRSGCLPCCSGPQTCAGNVGCGFPDSSCELSLQGMICSAGHNYAPFGAPFACGGCTIPWDFGQCEFAANPNGACPVGGWCEVCPIGTTCVPDVGCR